VEKIIQQAMRSRFSDEGLRQFYRTYFASETKKILPEDTFVEYWIFWNGFPSFSDAIFEYSIQAVVTDGNIGRVSVKLETGYRSIGSTIKTRDYSVVREVGVWKLMLRPEGVQEMLAQLRTNKHGDPHEIY